MRMLDLSGLKGSVIIFTGLASRCFLNKRLAWHQWTGIGVISSGMLLVGASDLYNDNTDSDHYKPLLGDIIIVAAEVGGSARPGQARLVKLVEIRIMTRSRTF